MAEGRAASALNHPNIVRVYDADVDGTSYYLVSEWLEGKSLRDELSTRPAAVETTARPGGADRRRPRGRARHGIVHRDIKPENIMLARDGTARIVDFGLARSDPHAAAGAGTIGHATTVTLEGGLSGTPAYMSPEQARGTAGDFRTDQFSFGALLYEMATGKYAFRRDTMADTLAAVLARRAPADRRASIRGSRRRCAGPSSGASRRMPPIAIRPPTIWRASCAGFAIACPKLSIEPKPEPAARATGVYGQGS